jgi:hypothetical protein
MAGCSGLEYSRVSGETYYSWLVSSYSPVVQFGEKRLEGEGVCFHLNAGKSQIQGFVTIQDLSAAAIANPDLVARARLYQQAFSEGMLKGMTDSVNESARLADGSSILAKELDTPAHLKRYSQEWQAWRNGYRYGERFGGYMRGGKEGAPERLSRPR